MFMAIRSGDVDEVLRRLEADPTLLEKEGRVYGSYLGDAMTPVLLAASVGKLDLVKLLVGRGANIHATSSENGMAALHYAAEEGHEGVVVYLLDNGADPIRLDDLGCTPLMWASRRGHLGVVLLLVKHMGGPLSSFRYMGGQGLETRDKMGQTALNLAIRGCHEEVAAELLRHGARADTRDKYGNSALSTAVRRGHVGVVKLLVDHLETQALDERDRMGKSLLHHAVDSAQEDMVAYLLGKGLQPSITDTRGMTPLMYGAKRSDPATVRVLERLLSHMHTHELDTRDAIEGKTALHFAVHHRNPAALRALLVAGADPSILDNEERAPRVRAGEGHCPECVAVFEWWDCELERRFLLCRARAFHDAYRTHQQAPTRPVPGYLKARVEAGLALPQVKVVEGEVEGTDSDGGGKRTRDEREVLAVEEQQERHAMLGLVVGQLSEELFTELMGGFHAPRNAGWTH